MADNEYRVLRGCNYPPNDTRANRGDVVTLPDAVASELLQLGAIEAVEPPAPEKKARGKAKAAADAQQAPGGSTAAAGAEQ